MKIRMLPILLLALAAISIRPAFADAERYVTVTLNNPPSQTNNNGSTTYTYSSTNFISIADGETGELMFINGQGFSANGNTYPAPVQACVQKDGIVVIATPANITLGTSGSRGTVVAGPAQFLIALNTSSTFGGVPGSLPPNPAGMMTVKITPQTFASDKTVLVAPGMGNVQINLESSTNLNQWSTATNGVYSDDMRFFRVKLTKVN